MARRRGRAARSTPLDEALAGAGDGAVGIDAEGRITSWNQAAEEILGHAAADVLGRPCWDVFGGHDADGNSLCHPGCRVMTLLDRRERVRPFDMRARTRAGQAVWLNVSVLTTTLPGGERRLIHLFRDVTAARELLALVHERVARDPDATGPAGPAAALSRRELEVLRCLTQGLSTAATAERLGLSPATIRNHVQSIFDKLGVHSRLQAVAFATRCRLF